MHRRMECAAATRDGPSESHRMRPDRVMARACRESVKSDGRFQLVYYTTDEKACQSFSIRFKPI